MPDVELGISRHMSPRGIIGSMIDGIVDSMIIGICLKKRWLSVAVVMLKLMLMLMRMLRNKEVGAFCRVRQLNPGDFPMCVVPFSNHLRRDKMGSNRNDTRRTSWELAGGCC